MAAEARATKPAKPAAGKGKKDAAPEKREEGEVVEIPLGIAAVLPAEDLEGTLVPKVTLAFDPAPGDVSTALATPKSLTVKWPLRGKAANLHDLTLPAQLSWLMCSPDGTAVLRTTVAPGDTKVKIDGSGRFELLVGGQPPVLDMIAAGLVGNGKVGYQVTLASPPGAAPQSGPDRLAFNLGCAITVKTDPPEKPRLGDVAHYQATAMHDLLKQIPLELRIVEQDATDAHGIGDTVALRREYAKGGIKPLDWTIGFADPDGSFAKFSYTELYEEGAFEYGWQLFAKAPSTGQWAPILTSQAPFSVEKPSLTEFHVHADNPAVGQWTVAGRIEGFSEHAPRIRVALAMVDAAGQRYPADLGCCVHAALDTAGKFEVTLIGPKVTPAATGETPPASAFAILSLVPTWNGKGEQHSVSGFLGYDEEKFALYDPKQSTSWEKSCAWIASQESTGIAPRGRKPRAGGEHIPAPGPGDAGSQSGELTFEEHILDTIAWEGKVPHLYLDSRGYMTVGIGICLVTEKKPRDPTRALTLPFKNLETGKPATETEIRAAFDKVVAMPPRLDASRYETHPRLELDEATMRQMVRDYVDAKALPALRANFPEWNSFPKCVRRALLDIVYNCGPAFLDDNKPKQPAKSPKLRAAVLAKKWDVAAAEVPKKGRAGRRQWRMELFTFAHRLGGGKLGPTS